MINFNELPKMVGTEGGADYRVLATSGTVALGVKPIFKAVPIKDGGIAIGFGFRVRVAKDPESTVAVADVSAVGPQVFPQFEFEKEDEVRLSLTRGGTVVLQPNKIKKGLDDLYASIEDGTPMMALQKVLDEAMAGASAEVLIQVSYMVDGIRLDLLNKIKALKAEVAPVGGPNNVTPISAKVPD